MNLFNCFQATAFYTIAPFGIQWLISNSYNGWAYIACFAQLVGFVMISLAISDSKLLD